MLGLAAEATDHHRRCAFVLVRISESSTDDLFLSKQSLFITLILDFWFSVVFSAFVHTLHPHIFMSPDSDSEDEFSDGGSEDEFERQEAFEKGSRNSGITGAPPSYDGGVQRSNSRRRQAWSSNEPEPALLEFSPEKERRRSGSRNRAAAAQQYSSSDSYDDGSASSSEEEETAQQAGLISSSAGRIRARTSRRVGSASEGEGRSASTSPPAYSTGTRSRRGSATSEKSLGRSGGRPRSRSRSRVAE
jgi:hypothetical protein